MISQVRTSDVLRRYVASFWLYITCRKFQIVLLFTLRHALWRDKVEWHVRALCFPYEEIHYMTYRDDEKFIVYMFEYPVEFRGGKQILASKLRIIDIENCKEYEINPFE